MAKIRKTVWFIGGFGNNLFQLLLVERFYNLGYDVKVVSVLTKKNIITRILGWTIFTETVSGLIKKYPDIKFEARLKFSHIKSLVFFLLSKLISSSVHGYLFFKSYNEVQIRSSNNFIGYFQNEDYLMEYINEIKQLSDYFNEKYILNKKYYLVLHFRWGDTDWGRKYEYYYQKARELIKSKNAYTLIVTDDLNKAKSFFSKINNIQFKRSHNPFDDFLILLNAETLILAPSTFSWWAALLTKQAKKIYAPKEIIAFLPIITNNKIVNAI